MKNILLATVVFVSVTYAQAYSCRDYYVAYVNAATQPAPTPIIILPAPPRFHNHYPAYHDHRGDNHSNNDDNTDVAILAVISGLITTTAMEEDAKLKDAQNVINIIDQADLGDGPQLRTFANQVQTQSPRDIVSVPQISFAVSVANQNLEFCQNGDLDTVSELASRIANKINTSH